MGTPGYCKYPEDAVGRKSGCGASGYLPQLFVKARSGVFGLFLSSSRALYAKI